MKDEQQHDNAESRRQKRREHDKEQYRQEGNEMRQGGPEPNLSHHDRTRSGDGSFTPDSQADTGSSDGIAKTIGGDGGNNGGRYHNLDEVQHSPTPDADQNGTMGAGESREPQLRTPSAQTSNTSQGPRSEQGQSGSQGSKSGNQQ